MAAMTFEGNRELRWVEVGLCLITFMEAEVEFSDREWDDWMEALERPSVERLILGSWGPTQPSHQQWRRATRLMRDRGMPVVVISEARHNFALAKAASWLGTDVQAFRWSELDEALDALGLDERARVIIRARVTALRDQFGPMAPSTEFGQPTATKRMVPGSSGIEYEASSAVVFENNEEIQAKLAEIQARLAGRSRR